MFLSSLQKNKGSPRCVTLRCHKGRCDPEMPPFQYLLLEAFWEGRLYAMSTYKYYCKAFPVRNKAYNFLGGLVRRDLALVEEGTNRDSLRRALISVCREVDVQKELNCAVVVSLSCLTRKTFAVRRAAHSWGPNPARGSSALSCGAGGSFCVRHLPGPRWF